MKRKLLLLLTAILALLPARLSADEFTYSYAGATIKYTVLDEEAKTCEVASRNNEVVGRIVLPKNPKDGETEYTLTAIGDMAFVGNFNLTNVEIPESVKTIGEGAFANCRSLSTIELSGYLESIGRDAFVNCTQLNTISIPKSVKFIGYDAFSGCQLNSVEFASVESLCSIEFETAHANPLSSGYTSLVINGEWVRDVVIPKSVKSIGNYAFNGARDIQSVTMVNGVTSIGKYTFYGCENLLEVSIPASVKSIGEGAFYGCINLKTADFASIKALCEIDFKNYLSNPIAYTHKVVIGGEEVTDLVIPTSVVSIGDYTFMNCPELTSVTFPSSIKSIGTRTFDECQGLTSVYIPASMETIGDYAFAGCTNITKVEYESIESLFSIEFGVCGNPLSASSDGHLYIAGQEVTEVDIPASVTAINGALAGARYLTAVTIPNTVTTIGTQAFFLCASLTAIDIPNSVTKIGDGAFDGCASLTSIDIPNAVTEIGGSAFSGCAAITSIDIPNAVKVIESSTFSGCSALTSINIPNTVTEIGSYVFSRCTSLDNVTLPDKITRLLDGVFRNCASLTSIKIPNSVMVIGSSAFAGCTSLANITLSSNITAINSQAFANCTALKEIVLPPAVDRIGSEAFTNCTELSNIVLGSNLKVIYPNAFIGTKAQTVSITAPIPPEIYGESLFDNYSGKLYVQDEEAVKLYAEAPFWGNFKPSVMTVAEEMTGDTHVDFTGKEGEQIQLTASIEPADASLPQIFWRSTNPEIATVDGNGLVTLQMDLTGLLSRADDESGLVCKIIAETLYADGPMLEFTVIDTQIEEGDEFSYEYEGQTLIYTVVDTEAKTVMTKSGRSFHPGNNVSGALIIPEKVKDYGHNVEYTVAYIGDYSFNDCKELVSVVIPNTVTEIGTRAFIGCEKLSAAVIPNSVTKIGYEAYNQCASLASVNIPGSVTEIGGNAFNECNSLTAVYYDTESPVESTKNIFSDATYENATLYVPESALDTFEATTPWMYFQKIQGHDFSGIEGITTDNGADIDYNSPYEVYDLNGRLAGRDIETVAPGMYILRQGKTVKKVVIR